MNESFLVIVFVFLEVLPNFFSKNNEIFVVISVSSFVCWHALL